VVDLFAGERFAVERFAVDRLAVDRFAVDRLAVERFGLGLVFLPVVTTRWSVSACLAAAFCALPALLRESLRAFSRSLSTSLLPRPSSLRISLSASSAVSNDFVNRVHVFWLAAEPPERARDAVLFRVERAARLPVLLVAISSPLLACGRRDPNALEGRAQCGRLRGPAAGPTRPPGARPPRGRAPRARSAPAPSCGPRRSPRRGRRAAGARRSRRPGARAGCRPCAGA
jgi:hypothetical protein